MGKIWTVLEKKIPHSERQLLAPLWGLKSLTRYTIFLPIVDVTLPTAAEYIATRKDGMHVNLPVKLFELQSSGNVRFCVEDGAWVVEITIAKMFYEQPNDVVQKLMAGGGTCL